MRKLFRFFVLALCLVACAPKGERGGNRDWTIFRGDPALSGYTATALPAKPKLLWSFQTGPRTVSSPLVRDGVVYWCDRRGMLYGVNEAGKQVYGVDLGTLIEATPLIYGDVLYIGTIDGHLLAVSLSDGSTVWDYATEGQISGAPNRLRFAGRDAIVVGSYDNWMHCVDAADGTLLSRFESGYYLNGAVAAHKQSLLFGGCDQYVRIIDGEAGVQTDSLHVDAYIPGSPAIVGDVAYIGDYAGNIYEIEIADSRFAAHRKIREAEKGEGDFTSIPAVDSKAVYAYTGDRHLAAYSRKDGSELWSVLMKGLIGESSPLVCRDKVLACTKLGIISIFDKDDGRLLWEYDAGEDILGSPAVMKGRFYVLTAKGTLLCFGNK